jgi:hypothetical protein
MSKLRSVSTGFWSDPLIEDLKPNEKLLFLYLITNEKTNMLGIYESSSKKMSFETGIPIQDLEKILKALEGFKRIKRVGNWVLLVNYMKHQNYNPNMKKSAIAIFNELPNELSFNKIDTTNGSIEEQFERVSKALGMVRKYEYEYEDESKDEDESKKKEQELKEKEILFDSFWDLYDKKVGDKDKIKSKFDDLKDSEIELIFIHIPKYKIARPDKQYRKDPSAYLNQKSWNDEIIGAGNIPNNEPHWKSYGKIHNSKQL